MSYCPRPSKCSKTAYGGAPGTATINPPPQRTEACNTSAISSTTGTGSSTSTSTVVQGPMGPAGPAGTNGLNGLSWFFRGEWGTGATYETADLAATDNNERIYDVVTHQGQTWICIQDHTSDGSNEPQLASFTGPTDWASYWKVLAVRGEAGLDAKQKTWLDRLNDVVDWVENASLEDWLEAAAIAAGVALAGAVIVDMLTDDGTGDGNADQQFSGTPGYNAAYTAPPLNDFLHSVCDYAGVPGDVSLIDPDQTVEMTIPSNSGARDILEQLSLAYQFDQVTSGGILKFVPKKTTADAVIPLEDIGFTDGSSNVPAPYTSKRYQGVSLPQKVSLTYYSTDFDYNPYTQSYELFGYDEGQNVQLSVPVTLSHEEAKRIAETSLINAHLERMNYKFTTSYKYCFLEPADVIEAPMGLVRILRLDESQDGLLEFECCDAGTAESYSGSGSDVQYPAPSINVVTDIGYSKAMWFDPNALNDQDTKVRIYAAVHGYGRKGWPGASIQQSIDGGNTFTELMRVFEESTVGLVAVPTPNHPYYTWDETTQISVQLKTGSLLSKSEIAVLNGDNWCQIGQEIIGFKNATLTAPNTYTLSGLLRGRQGTEIFTGTHVANELFVLLDGAPAVLEFNNSDRMTTRKFKVVTIGSSTDVTPAESVQIFSNNTRAWAVYDAALEHMPNSDWVISWKGRSRFDNKLKDFSTTNHDETFGGYGIAVLGAGDVVLKTYTTTSETFTLTSALQTSDLGGLQSTLKVSIVPMDKTFGGGYPTIVNS